MTEVQRAVMLYSCREAAKRILGARYRTKVAECSAAIRTVASHLDCSEVKALTKMSDQCDCAEHQIVLYAAFAEMLAPSEQDQTT